MYTKKEVNKQIKLAQEQGNKEVYNMLQDYFRLKFSWIPQIKKKLEPDLGGLYTPHRSTLKKEFEPHSVKRESDGVVFTVGDLVDCPVNDLNRPAEIVGFKTFEDGVRVELKDLWCFPLNIINLC